jgi:hypothetical protein
VNSDPDWIQTQFGLWIWIQEAQMALKKEEILVKGLVFLFRGLEAFSGSPS